MKDKIQWFGDKGSVAKDTIKMSSQAIVAVTSVVIAGAVLGAASKLWK